MPRGKTRRRRLTAFPSSAAGTINCPQDNCPKGLQPVFSNTGIRAAPIAHGVRLPETMDNPELWYSSNKYGGTVMAVVVAVILAMTIALYFVHGLAVTTYAEILGGLTTVNVLAVACVIYRFVQKNK